MSSTIAKSLLCIAGALWTAGASAGSQSYMSLVGELVGKVESLRMLHDYCLNASPQTADANKHAYEAWAQRNADLLALVKTQRSHADRRLAKQAAAAGPSIPKSTTEIVVLLEQHLSAQLRGADANTQQSFCAKYPELISSSEKARNEEIVSLLKTVTDADEVLSEREKQ